MIRKIASFNLMMRFFNPISGS